MTTKPRRGKADAIAAAPEQQPAAAEQQPQASAAVEPVDLSTLPVIILPMDADLMEGVPTFLGPV